MAVPCPCGPQEWHPRSLSPRGAPCPGPTWDPAHSAEGLMLPVACLGAAQSQQPLDSFLHDCLGLWLQPVLGLCGPCVPGQSPPLSPPQGDRSAALLCSSRGEVSGAGLWPLSLEPSADTLPKIAPLLLPTVPWRRGSETALVRSEAELPVGALGLLASE